MDALYHEQVLLSFQLIYCTVFSVNSSQNTAAVNALQQQLLLAQQLQILTNSPFGDSPLFRNSLVVSKWFSCSYFYIISENV